jgi:hypothetical protein
MSAATSSYNTRNEIVQAVEDFKDDGVERGRLAGVKMNNNTETKYSWWMILDYPSS